MQVQGKDGVDQLKERMQSEGIGALYQGAVAQALATFVSPLSVHMETIALVARFSNLFRLDASPTMALLTLASFCPGGPLPVLLGLQLPVKQSAIASARPTAAQAHEECLYG